MKKAEHFMLSSIPLMKQISLQNKPKLKEVKAKNQEEVNDQ